MKLLFILELAGTVLGFSSSILSYNRIACDRFELFRGRVLQGEGGSDDMLSLLAEMQECVSSLEEALNSTSGTERMDEINAEIAKLSSAPSVVPSPLPTHSNLLIEEFYEPIRKVLFDEEGISVLSDAIDLILSDPSNSRESVALAVMLAFESEAIKYLNETKRIVSKTEELKRLISLFEERVDEEQNGSESESNTSDGILPRKRRKFS